MQKYVIAFIFITLTLAEFAGFQIAILTPDWPIPSLLYVEWIFFQVAVSLMLLVYVGQALWHKEKEAARLLSMFVFCLTFQGWGVLHSQHQMFAAASTLADSLLIFTSLPANFSTFSMLVEQMEAGRAALSHGVS